MAKKLSKTKKPLAKKKKETPKRRAALPPSPYVILTYGFVDDKQYPFTVFLGEDIIQLEEARRRRPGHFELTFKAGDPAVLAGAQMFTTSVGMSGSRVPGQSAFVREVTDLGNGKRRFTVNTAILREQSNSSFYFMIVGGFAAGFLHKGKEEP